MRVLVVDDSGAMRKLIIKALSGASEKMEFLEAEDGKDALFKVKMKKFDMILLDWNMPNLSGLETLQQLRKSGNKTPVVMVTTNAEKPQIIKALKAGANDYVIKPFTPGLLLEKVEKNLIQPDDIPLPGF